jgi:hypothetical protein
MTINTWSLIKSGFISGLIINISAIGMVPMIGNQFDRVLSDRGLPPLSNLDMVYFSSFSFAMGFFLVWLYAVTKVLFGSGIKTAIILAIVLWVIAYLFPNVAMVVYGFMPIRLTVIGTAWGLLELTIASIVGSKLYSDATTKS